MRSNHNPVLQSNLGGRDGVYLLPKYGRRLEKGDDVTEHDLRLIARGGKRKHVTNLAWS